MLNLRGTNIMLCANKREPKRTLIILILLSTTIPLTQSNNHPNPKSQIHPLSNNGLNFFKTTITTPPSPNAAVPAVTAACKSTLYPAACHASLARAMSKSPHDLFVASVESAKLRAASARAKASGISPTHAAIEDCLELLDISIEQLDGVIDASGRAKTESSGHDIQTWLSAALTNQVTCADGLGEGGGVDREGKERVMEEVNGLSEYISNALALQARGMGGGGGRRLWGRGGGGFPEWVREGDRKLLEGDGKVLEGSAEDIRAVAVVAKDGSGTHGSINEAIAFVSLAAGGGGGRSVIYVKAGTYREYIKIPTKQKNVMLMGDGKGQTIIIGSRNAEDGSSTYQSATVGNLIN